LDTLTHPVFGLGAGEFGNYEGKERGRIGGGWSTSHNSYSEISADTGLPGIFLYLAGTVSAFLLLQRTRKLALKTPQGREMATACFLISVSMIGYCVVIGFLNFGYFFELPAFAGLITSLSAAVKRETDILSVSKGNPRAEVPKTVVGPRRAQAVAGKTHPVLSPNRFGFGEQG
jgi:O-antigen ligase